VVTADPHSLDTGSSQALSVHYPRILKPELIGRYRAIYNLHPALLPWGRGFYPAFWALWEGTPAGATLHVMEERLDAGPICLQRQVPYDDTDTGGSLHGRVTSAEKALLIEAWRTLGRGGDLTGTPQPSGGSYHSRAEFDRLHSGLKADDLSDAQLARLARCLTFRGYPGLVVESNGSKRELAVGSDGAIREVRRV
jgi:methionyl-tRNA formyltransferase